MLRYGILAACAMGAMNGSGQSGEHPFIESFELAVQEGRVLVQWVMKGGSTCDGSAVERSIDGVSFDVVHRIDGLCGDPSVAVPFSFADEDPPELSTLHYRIELGSEGRSSVKSVRFEQLTRSEQRFFPSPTRGEATLLLNVPQGEAVELRVIDAGGRVVMERDGLTGNRHALDLHDLGAGVYSYVAVTDGRRFSGRFVKQ